LTLAAPTNGSGLKILGTMDYLTYESSPLFFNGEMIIMETITQFSPAWAGHWDPRFAACASYFRVRDMHTGTVIVNITETCNHSFGSATVNVAVDGDETLFIFGTPWVRPVLDENGRETGPWSGPCSVGNCSIDTYWSFDLISWETERIINLPKGMVAYNTDVGPVNSTTLPYRYVLALEIAASPYDSVFLVTNATFPSSGWVMLNNSQYRLRGGSCPSIRYLPSDGNFYMLYGNLFVARSPDLMNWTPGLSNKAIISPSSADRQIAPYANWNPSAAVRKILSDGSYDMWTSDGDFAEMPGPFTLIWYVSSNQGVGGPYIGFPDLAVVNSSMASWMQSWF